MSGVDWAATLILVLIGYLIGSVNFAIIFARIFRNEDIRKKGSGNAGATNVRRNYGISAGRWTGVFDVFKILLALSIAWILKVCGPFFRGAFVPVVGIATVVGHIFPLYFRFKGGKGVACLFGFLSFYQWWLAPLGLLTFVLIIKKTRLVSLGSLIAPGLWIVFGSLIYFSFDLAGWEVVWDMPIARLSLWWQNALCFCAAHLLVVAMHFENIKRIMSGQERKLPPRKKV